MVFSVNTCLHIFSFPFFLSFYFFSNKVLQTATGPVATNPKYVRWDMSFYGVSSESQGVQELINLAPLSLVFGGSVYISGS